MKIKCEDCNFKSEDQKQTLDGLPLLSNFGRRLAVQFSVWTTTDLAGNWWFILWSISYLKGWSHRSSYFIDVVWYIYIYIYIYHTTTSCLVNTFLRFSLFSISPEKIFQYMKEKRFFQYQAKWQMAKMKPIVCHGNSRFLVAFSTSNNKRTEHHLCRVCDRGFPTYKGLSDHYTHPVHTSQERKEIEKIKKVCGSCVIY